MKTVTSKLDSYFEISKRRSSVKTEVLAGITTFLTMSYILAVNPGILGTVMPAPSVFTATVISSAVATLVMGLWARIPIALAPGMGLNAFFAFTVVIGMGIPFQTALTALLLEGVIFIILTLCGVRQAIVKAIPSSLQKAIAVGIGFFIALIGCINAGIVVGDPATVVSLGELRGGGTAMVALIGFAITIILYSNKVPAAILLGIFITTIIGIPFGITHIENGFNPVSLPAAPLLFKFSMSKVFTLKFLLIFLTFFITDVFDTVGTFMATMTQAKLVDKNGNFPRMKEAFISDALGTVVGSMTGTSATTSYIESGSGIAAGGRTGFASVITALLFVIALFLSPLFLLIPSAATAPALILVGFLMVTNITDIKFDDPSVGIPAFMTIAMTVFAYSITQGICFGIISYVIIKLFKRKMKDIAVSTWVLFAVFILNFFLG
jgi:AGZA family xanthine/uracil permease-like MFS transporter